MKKYFTLLVLFINLCTISQNYKAPKTTDIYVVFKDTPYSQLKDNQILELNKTLREYDFIFEKASFLTDEKTEYLKKQAQKITGNSKALSQLQRLKVLRIKGGLPSDKKASVFNALRQLSFVEKIQEKNNTLVPPPTDIPPTTPNLIASQGYIQANPGVNMQFAWDNNYIGAGINIRDIEFGINVNHEEFNSTNTSIATGMTVAAGVTTSYTEHGTAAVGVVYSDNGTYGVSGLAHGANEVILYPEWTNENGYNRNYAVSEAINNSVSGDIIMYELQAFGVGGATAENYVPAEYELSIWLLTKAATDAGIVIVAAAGNGNQDLDSPDYSTYMNYGDSGAIIVGAGSSSIMHSRLSYSTYGSRVNVQGWGENVLAPGYGDYLKYGNDFNQQYTWFAGTSSATPIVTSCAAVLQSISYTNSGNYLTSQQIRDILIQTGYPQGGINTKNIGPLPNMENAIALLLNNLSTENFSQVKVTLYPNPATNTLTINTFDTSIKNADIIIFNTLGQIVLKDKVKANTATFNVSNLESGIYWAQIKNSSHTKSIKFIKK